MICSQPQTRSEVQQRKASLPIRLSFGRSQTSTRATQYEKVDPQMTDVRAHEVHLDQTLAVLTGHWPYEVEVRWEAQALYAREARRR